MEAFGSQETVSGPPHLQTQRQQNWALQRSDWGQGAVRGGQETGKKAVWV